MISSEITSNNKEILTLQSESAAWQLTDFFDQYNQVVDLLAVDQDIRDLLSDTKSGEMITEKSGYQKVYEHMLAIQQTDPENVMAVWIGDVDANVLTQSDGFTSGSDFEITQRAWYACTQTGRINGIYRENGLLHAPDPHTRRDRETLISGCFLCLKPTVRAFRRKKRDGFGVFTEI